MISKIEAIAAYLEVSEDEIEQAEYDENTFEVGGEEYRVLTDNEAWEACEEYVKDSAWAFNADFLESETGMPKVIFEALQPQCESANDAVLKLIEATCGLEVFVDSAVSADGRGYFLCGYDGEENECGDYFAYRIN